MKMAFTTTTHICNMNTDSLQLLFVILFLMICGYQTCSKIDFIQGSERVVTSENSIVVVTSENSIVNITFQLDTLQCPLNQTHYSIIISRLTNGSHVDVCKIFLTQKCTPSSSSTMCTCMSPHGPMLFSKKMGSEDNNTVYIWKWMDTLLGAQSEQVTFQIYRNTRQHGPTTTANHTRHDDDDQHPDAYTSTEETARSDSHPSLTIVFSSFFAGVTLLVITAAVTTTCIIIRRVGGRSYGNSQLTSDKRGSPSTHAPLEALASDDRDKTTDIYEEIQDSSELHIQHRGTLLVH
ncbi:uncharacterized protein LOC112568627 [Pomacea canaliculata]|uniref:uncharacterized protein LOC112568627 n=1 Tax=Pomacea canaliculata TaxID=400727 RepID=UPI000D73FF2B|nr:uncharacterized protein LOC112568627 [Pomacea canaliculata]